MSSLRLLMLATTVTMGAAATCSSGNTVTGEEPEAYKESLERFNKEYSTYHLYPKGKQKQARPASEEIVEAQEARNAMRDASRILDNAELYGDVVLTRRFCGLTYESGIGGVDCSPVDAYAYDLSFMTACWGARPVMNSTCVADDAGKGKVDFLKYGVSVSPPFVASLVLAIVFPILCLLWYVTRCCQLSGGRKPGGYFDGDSTFKAVCGFCCPALCKGENEHPGYSKMQINAFRLVFLIFFLVTLGGGIAGLTGNSLLGGLQDAIECALYAMADVVADVKGIFERANRIASGQMDTEQLGMIDEMACLIADAQKEMDDNSGIFEIRALAVLVVCLIPIVVCLLGVVAGLLRLKILSCCIAFQLGWLLVIVWLSFGLHGTLALIFGDMCVEMDLALHAPKGQHINIGFMPEGSLPCGGPDSLLSLLIDDIEKNVVETVAGPALKAGGDNLKDLCNQGGDYTDLDIYTIDCTQAAGPGKLLSGSPGSYVKESYSLDNFEHAKRVIKLGDPGVKDNNCLATVTPIDSNMCPNKNKDPKKPCKLRTEWWNQKGGNRTNPGNGNTTAVETRKTLRQCGMPSGGCEDPTLYKIACEIVSTNAGADLADFLDLRDTQIRPMKNCVFGGEHLLTGLFSAMYMPLCVDAVSGFGLVSAANGLGGAVMLMMLPFAVLATKRLDKGNSKDGDNKVTPEDDVGIGVVVQGA
jgi:hypothetical protein